MAEREGVVDIYNCVRELRSRRVNMVQTEVLNPRPAPSAAIPIPPSAPTPTPVHTRPASGPAQPQAPPSLRPRPRWPRPRAKRWGERSCCSVFRNPRQKRRGTWPSFLPTLLLPSFSFFSHKHMKKARSLPGNRICSPSPAFPLLLRPGSRSRLHFEAFRISIPFLFIVSFKLAGNQSETTPENRQAFAE